MSKLERKDLWSLEEYADRRAAFREEIMAHKKTRQVALSDNARLYFEDKKTIRYQVQEMLRIEKVFEASGIEEELEAYNPLIPDGHNWKATFMLEYTDVDERQQRVTELKGVEQAVWIQVEGFGKIHPVCDEDLDREDAERTSTVHFMRFELTTSMVAAVKNQSEIRMGIDHEHMQINGIVIDKSVQNSLANDLDDVLLN